MTGPATKVDKAFHSNLTGARARECRGWAPFSSSFFCIAWQIVIVLAALIATLIAAHNDGLKRTAAGSSFVIRCLRFDLNNVLRPDDRVREREKEGTTYRYEMYLLHKTRSSSLGRCFEFLAYLRILRGTVDRNSKSSGPRRERSCGTQFA